MTTRPKTDTARQGRNKPAPSPEELAPAVAGGAGCSEAITTGLLQTMMGSLKTDIFDKIDSLSTSLRSEMTSIRDELKKSIENVQQKLGEHGKNITELEHSTSDHSDRIGILEKSVGSLVKRVTELDNKCEDLESRMRRNNIRLLGIPEGVEGPRPTEFIAGLLQDVLGLEDKPLLDRAHRTLRERPGEGKPPRPFVIRVHFFHVRNNILKKASESSPILYRGKRVSLFADYTAAVAKRRASFGLVKRELRACPGVKYGLIYPATLKLTLPDTSTRTFDDPGLAEDFVKKNLKTAVVPTD